MTDQMTPVGGIPHRGGATSSGGGALSNPAVRAALLIVLAIIIGIVLLQVIDDGSGPIGDGGTTTTTTVAATTSTSRGTTTTTKPDSNSTDKVRTPQQVTVLVMNGSGVVGAASTLTSTLRSLGYQTLTPADAPAQTGNVVYYQAGYKRECATVSTTVGGNPAVKEVPTPVPAGAERANCVAIIGT